MLHFQMAPLIRLFLLLFWALTPICGEDSLDDRWHSNFIFPIPQDPGYSECTRMDGNKEISQRCVAEFENAAFNKKVVVSNTCGTRSPTAYCSQVSVYGGGTKSCFVCDDRVREYSHVPEFLTDFNDPKNETWWQSETMNEGIQYPQNVTMILDLGKAFDITYVRLKFISPRPESFIIYKKTTRDGEWIPWAFYSGSCKATFNMRERAPILPGNEDVAQCTREFSDISPLTGGNIAFSTLDGRPSAENFEESDVLQSWVTAVAVKVVLVRLNTFGDEVFKDPKVLKSYYYAISDFAVGGRCKCNGHANSCVMSSGIDVEKQLVCECQHNTAGSECQECDSFHQDRPWRRGTSEDANECIPCNCNGLSSRCYFDSEMYNQTGHGGHCLDCSGNTRGAHCEHCMEGFYRRPGEHFCVACGCNSTGSYSAQCNLNGQCDCKPGVGGERCDQCKNGFHDFSASGCKDCHCEASGSWNNQPNCDSGEGICQCKENVEGQKCDKCEPGYFNLSPKNPYGCTPCFCYGHSSVCSSADGFYGFNVTSTFDYDVQRWTSRSEKQVTEIQWDKAKKAAAVYQEDYHPVYFHAPSDFLGDLRFAYNQELSFIFGVEFEATAPSTKDIIIVGANGQQLTSRIDAQNNHLPDKVEQIYRYQLHQDFWAPKLNEIEFIGIFANVSAIKIRGTYSIGDVGYLSEISLSTASSSLYSSVPADWVEQCECPAGHVGQFCESCAPGYKRLFKFGGPLTKCIKCDCHGHSESCDAESGACICQHHTSGDTCESCARGYYGNALNGTETDCTKCDCPDGGPCLPLPEGGMACSECPLGHAGAKCEYCASEFYGNPQYGRPCLPCPCNDNIDFNAIGNCDSNNGECLKCIYNTIGFNCERCKLGFWGNATAETRNDCQACNCYPPGTRKGYGGDLDNLRCHPSSGQCECLPYVNGRGCDSCEKGFFNITSGIGCQQCECNVMGSEDGFCDAVTGKCKCKPGVTGLKCDKCAREFFGFSFEGCQACECDAIGAELRDCDVKTGQCLCRDNVEGRRCDQCSENRFNMRAGCLPCDDCYKLIGIRKNELATKMEQIDDGLGYWESHPVTVDDEYIISTITESSKSVQRLRNEMKKALDPSVIRHLTAFKQLGPRAHKFLSSLSNNTYLKSIDETAEDMRIELRDLKTIHANQSNSLDYELYWAKKEGKKRLQKLQKNFEKYGKYDANIYEMSKDASQYAKKHTEARNKIKEISEKVSNIVSENRREVHEAIHGDTSSSKVGKFEKMATETAALLNKTKVLAAERLAETEELWNKAFKLWRAANDTKLPDIDFEKIKSDLSVAQNETAFHKEMLKQYFEDSEHKRIRGEIKSAVTEARKLVKNLDSKNREKQQVLGQIIRQKNSTENAIKELQEQIEGAKKFLYDVERYANGESDLGRSEFIEALSNIDGTETDIKEANNKTKEARKMIGNSKAIMDQALSASLEAQKQAENLATQSEQLSEAVDNLAESTAKTNEKLGNIDDLLLMLNKSNDALEAAKASRKEAEFQAQKAAKLELKAINETQKMNKMEEIVKEMELRLASSEPVTDKQLDELERLNAEFKKDVKDRRFAKLIKIERNRNLEAHLDDIKKNFIFLQSELEQLQKIHDSLPEKCYNTVLLEQSGQ